MASSSSAAVKKTTAAKNPTTMVNPEGFVDEPQILEYNNISLCDEVLIPAKEPLNHAFVGPVSEPLESDDLKVFFPGHERYRPRIFSKNPFHLEFLNNPNRVFRAAPKVNQPEYFAWLNKIEAKKETIWKEQGIFDLIQLSRYGPKYDSLLILAALHFWDTTTHTFQLKCGMLSPTLLDVAAITGLKPLGSTFNPKRFSEEHEFDFQSNRASFSAYISDHHDTTTTEVSDEEHIAFLTFWLSYFVFCSRSLQTAKLYIPLAIQLHERKDICLAKLILGDLHLNLDHAIAEIKDDSPKESFLIGGPIWLLQLWLLATFEARLSLYIPEELQQALENRRTEGIRLAQLEGNQKNLALTDRFSCYFEMFQRCTTFLGSMAPFAVRTHGPTWFKRKLGATSPEHTEETNQIWQAYLSPCILSARLSPSSNASFLGISKYFPSYTSRQFGLCQLRPTSVHRHIGDLDLPNNEFFYKAAFKNFHYKNLHFEPIRFKVKFSCTEKFHKWWNDYYIAASEGLTDEERMRNLLAAIPQIKEKKPRGIVLS